MAELESGLMVLLPHIGLRGQNTLWLFFGLTHEFGDAGRATELIRLASDDPGAFTVSLGTRDGAELVAGLRLVVVLRSEAGKLLRGQQIAV